jgi:hypothetical protein
MISDFKDFMDKNHDKIDFVDIENLPKEWLEDEE